ncbi:ATP phosphoribosyltransferase regulatory subunit [Cohaesibacter celericrescens]|uniref:ATP phosphoribosyltransferase regulatory subunit n=2 Tax=Cohaesibacter celericrescens TaxID=2067669 RepID=A0A2N5XKP7_9HYPH|nr:ATP phosphoribosyltransferase regulatory subunit [Cohaesibacter celericrescens]PLW75010.1 ATP phosphoribosyltransferase regulatory subunit [Cohaesibacter celericrescens]
MTYLTDEMRKRLDLLLSEAGACPIDLPVLYHADLFVDLIGEDIRRRLYVAPGSNGEAMALRPEFTIPACLHHLSGGAADRPASYACIGPVFRQREDGAPGEFYQAGIEQIDPDGGVEFDANSVARAVLLVESLSAQKPVVTIGDLALFSSLLTALDAPAVWQRRLEGAFGDRKVLDRMLARLEKGGSENHGASAGLAKILDGKATSDVRDAVEEMLSIAGLTTVGGRSVGDIAERYMEKAELAAKAGWDADKLDVISRYLSISGSLDDSLERLTAFNAQEGGPLGAALQQFSDRIVAIRNAVPQGTPLQFKADFGRRLDYYSGFNFELNFDGQDKPVAGGGRYDRLLGLLAPRAKTDLGADIQAVPAIGFVIWLDRLTNA